MHFVKKVPTSDEEKAAKEKERFVKLKTFCAVRDKIFEKRKNNELDDELLSLTQKLLEKNPDIYTFWNIRRSVIEKKIEDWRQLAKETEDAKEVESYQKKIDDLLSGELFLTYTCLEANHKSYSAWFQRGWTLKQQTSPNIEKELVLCEKALKMDCRNFHCWDHRRVVAKMGNLSSEEELEFSNKLIAENFSNYSAWHYRATLLPRIQNEKTGAFKLEDATVGEELKKVTSAFFTDPDDQSAWVYSRWLLEMGSDKEWMRPDSLSPAVPLSVSFHGNNTTVVMSKACRLETVLTFVDSHEDAGWRALSAISAHPDSARVWQFLSDAPLRTRVNEESDWQDISEHAYANRDLLHKAFDILTRPASAAISTITENCKELIEMEPKNMWALYMYTLCLMETKPAEAHTEIIANLEKLASELDTKRKEIYKSIAARQLLNDAMRAKNEEGKILINRLLDGEETGLALRRKGIASVDGVELLAGFLSELDVSANQLTRIDDILLPNLKSLVINDNPIQSLPACPVLCGLSLLSMASCQVSKVSDVMPAVQGMCSLERLLYCETPLVEHTKELAAALPGVRLIPHWL